MLIKVGHSCSGDPAVPVIVCDCTEEEQTVSGSLVIIYIIWLYYMLWRLVG